MNFSGGNNSHKSIFSWLNCKISFYYICNMFPICSNACEHLHNDSRPRFCQSPRKNFTLNIFTTFPSSSNYSCQSWEEVWGDFDFTEKDVMLVVDEDAQVMSPPVPRTVCIRTHQSEIFMLWCHFIRSTRRQFKSCCFIYMIKMWLSQIFMI